MAEILMVHAGLPPRLRRLAIFRGQAAACRRELSNLVGDEHFAVDHFVRITVATALAIGPERVPLWGRLDGWSAACPRRWVLARPDLPRRFRVGWDCWLVVWDEMIERNPRLGLVDVLSDIADKCDPRNFEAGVDLGLLDWVDRGKRKPVPWSSGHSGPGATPGDYHVLRDLRRELGGWIFRDGRGGERTFRPDAEIGVIRSWFAP